MNRIFPYPTLSEPLELTVRSVALDGITDPSLLVVDDHLHVSPERTWTEMELGLEVVGPRTIEPNVETPVVAAVAACGPSNLRVATRLARSVTDSARWSGSIRISRDATRGSLALKAIIGGRIGGRDGRFAGESKTVTVQIDESSISPITGTVAVRWIDFHETSPAHPDLTRFSNEAFYIHVSDVGPVVFLNSGFPRLSAVLSERTGLPAAAQALRSTLGNSIAMSAWMAMFNTAAGDVVQTDDGDPLELPTGWKGDVLQRLIVQIFPLESPESGLSKLRDAWRADGGSGTQSLLVAAVEGHVGSGKVLRRAFDAMKNELLRPETEDGGANELEA